MLARSRPGASLIEVIVILVIVLVLAIVLITALPRGRENARATTCQRNLRDIGVAIVEYEQAIGMLPQVRSGAGDRAGPLATITEGLGVTDLGGLAEGRVRVGAPGTPASEAKLPGFLCPADPVATASKSPAPVSYRANTGDTTDGQGGPFAFGTRRTLKEVEEADGLDYTVGFSERLVGGGGHGGAALRAYGLVRPPVGPEGCPAVAPGDLRDNAGSSWLKADWTSTLYNHAMPPNAQPSCVASDGTSARMGASSGHPAGVHVLFLSGAVTTFSSRVDPGLWSKLATVHETELPEPTGPTP